MSILKDYYDILGIRPTAKPAEIELAVKGRRTQYHPDKYGDADADTIRWATEKMQEVNEAYAVLCDADARARYDQGRQSHTSGAHHSSRANRSGRAETNEDAVTDIPFILDYLAALPLSREDAKRFHFAPSIPQQKLTNALACRRYYAMRPPNQVYVLIDDTAFGSGADGLLITDEIISFKNLYSDASDYIYTKGWNGEFHVEGSAIKRHGDICKTFYHISPSAVQMLVWGLNQFFVDRLEWHTGMALRGDADSQFLLSLSCYEKPAEAFHWLTMAAENAHVSAQHNLGKYYADKNPQLAFQWFTKAAQQGSTNAQRELGSDIFKQFY